MCQTEGQFESMYRMDVATFKNLVLLLQPMLARDEYMGGNELLLE